jgi:hypothetical protein
MQWHSRQNIGHEWYSRHYLDSAFTQATGFSGAKKTKTNTNTKSYSPTGASMSRASDKMALLQERKKSLARMEAKKAELARSSRPTKGSELDYSSGDDFFEQFMPTPPPSVQTSDTVPVSQGEFREFRDWRAKHGKQYAKKQSQSSKYGPMSLHHGMSKSDTGARSRMVDSERSGARSARDRHRSPERSKSASSDPRVARYESDAGLSADELSVLTDLDNEY